MKKTKFLVYLLLILSVTLVDINSQELIDAEDEDVIDFASPGDNKADEDKDDSCNTSPHSDLLDLLNVKYTLILITLWGFSIAFFYLRNNRNFQKYVLFFDIIR